MKVSYFLSRPAVDAATSIYARICYSGFKFKYYTPESIHPKFWNKTTRRVKETQKFREYPEFNTRLNNIDALIKTTFRKYVNDNPGVIPSPEQLKTMLDDQLKNVQVAKDPAEFLCFFTEIIEQTRNGTRLHHKTGNPIGATTLKTYKTAFKHLTAFQLKRKVPIKFKDINLDFYAEFTEYLMKTVNLASNSVGRQIKIIKLLMNEATERGLNTNLSFKGKRFITVSEKSDSIYLTADEISELGRLDLSANSRLERVRDLFLIGCYTGLQYSDYSILQPSHIKDGFIETTQVKTGDKVVIPIHRTVETIIVKYAGKLPTAISNQKTNGYLKEIGKMIETMGASFIKTKTKGGARVSGKPDGSHYKRWELLSSHTARRSFATNEYLAGTPSITIMAITGHKTETAFLRYIKVTPNEHAKLLKLQWEKRSLLRVV